MVGQSLVTVTTGYLTRKHRTGGAVGVAYLRLDAHRLPQLDCLESLCEEPPVGQLIR